VIEVLQQLVVWVVTLAVVRLVKHQQANVTHLQHMCCDAVSNMVVLNVSRAKNC
jgi:hypothetical protein